MLYILIIIFFFLIIYQIIQISSINKKIYYENALIKEQILSNMTNNFNQINNKIESIEIFKKTVDNFINNLKNPNNRGEFGEIQLKNLLESANLIQYCDFSTKENSLNGIPDFIINLPNNIKIFVDVKTPECVIDLNTIDKKIIETMQNHIRELGNKEYWKNETSPKFTILYLPTSAAYFKIINIWDGFLNYCNKYNVIPTQPEGFLALVKIINNYLKYFIIENNIEIQNIKFNK